MKINNQIKEIKKWIKKKNKEDIKNELNPLYSIKIGSWYASEELFEDVEQLMIAVGETFYEKGLKQFQKEIKEFQEDLKFCAHESNGEKLLELNFVLEKIKNKFGVMK